jgi:hypothetical protein
MAVKLVLEVFQVLSDVIAGHMQANGCARTAFEPFNKGIDLAVVSA